jgi:hypothetical protein
VSDLRYFEALLQVPSTEVPDDCTVAQRRFEISRHGGMVLIRIGPTVPGPDGDSYSVLLATGHAKAVIHTLEVIVANIGC